MKPYNFKNVFLKYMTLLSALLIFIYLSIYMIFTWQVNVEINETAEKELKLLQHTLNQQERVNAGHPYFVMRGNDFITNHTGFSETMLRHNVLLKDLPLTWNVSKHNFYVNKGKLSDGKAVYSFLEISDYEETKTLLLNLLVILMLITFVLCFGAAYYIAVKPVRAYEKMIAQHKSFIQNASHELKTPMAAISLGIDYVNALDGKQLSETSKQSLDKMKQEIKYAQRITLRALQISHDEEVSIINVSEVLDDVITQQEALHHIIISRDYHDTLHYLISYDRLKQMLIILIDNAVKHGGSPISIRIGAKILNQQLQIEVEDNGKGIKAQDIDQIFQRHFRGDTETEGSGIGLAILKELVSEIGGSIEVKSEMNKKTIFILKI